VTSNKQQGPHPHDSPRFGVIALAFSHGANDMYMGFLPALLPLIILNLNLDYKSAGVLVSIVTITSQFSQPLFGFIGDRVNRRVIAVAAPSITALSLAFLGFAQSYSALVTLLVIGSIATAAFHPQGAALIRAVARRRPGLAMASFTAGGNIGYGVGSLLIAAIVSHLGYNRTWLTLPIGLASSAFLIRIVPASVEAIHRQSLEQVPHGPEHWRRSLTILYFVVMLRAATATVFTTFVPVLIEHRSKTLILGGWALLGFTLAGAVGGFIGGQLSENFGRRAVTAMSLTLTGPALFLFLHTSGFVSAFMLLITGMLLFAALPINIVMAQELLPRHASTVSGIIMGLAWGIGGVAAVAVGTLADQWSSVYGQTSALARAIDFSTILPLTAGLLAILLPSRRAPERGTTH